MLWSLLMTQSWKAKIIIPSGSTQPRWRGFTLIMVLSCWHHGKKKNKKNKLLSASLPPLGDFKLPPRGATDSLYLLRRESPDRLDHLPAESGAVSRTPRQMSARQDIHTWRCRTRAERIIKDFNHPTKGLLSLLLSDLRAKTERMWTHTHTVYTVCSASFTYTS